jgi:SAM-dependent methyltransferase
MSTRTVGPAAEEILAAIAELRQGPERSRPDLLLEFHPGALREAGLDPVSVLDRFRALGLRAVAATGELPTDPGELTLAVEGGGEAVATLRLAPVAASPGVGERLQPAVRRLGRRWARTFPPGEPPGTLEYDATHRALVGSLLDEPAWRELFASNGALPAGLGAGYDERVVEYPWLFSRDLGGRVLDAGSVTNHRHILERLLLTVDDLTIATLAPEPLAFNSMGVSYLYADLRELPLRDNWYDQVICLSTLEHVGMDNTLYGGHARPDADPAEAAARAFRELLRVVRPGGRIHLSVPFGRHEDHGWFRQFAREDVDSLFEGAGVGRREEAVFLHSERGWRRLAAARAADVAYNSESGRAADLAVAARAVLCATIYV